MLPLKLSVTAVVLTSVTFCVTFVVSVGLEEGCSETFSEPDDRSVGIDEARYTAQPPASEWRG